MAYVPVPKDLTKVKTKVFFGLTRRQLLCFGAGALIGVPLYFLLKDYTGSTVATLCMVIVMLPAFLLAMYERNGQHLETIVRHMLLVFFVRPKQRRYETGNFYLVLERQHQLDEEVHQIVQSSKTRKQEPRNTCP